MRGSGNLISSSAFRGRSRSYDMGVGGIVDSCGCLMQHSRRPEVFCALSLAFAFFFFKLTLAGQP